LYQKNRLVRGACHSKTPRMPQISVNLFGEKMKELKTDRFTGKHNIKKLPAKPTKAISMEEQKPDGKNGINCMRRSTKYSQKREEQRKKNKATTWQEIASGKVHKKRSSSSGGLEVGEERGKVKRCGAWEK